MRIGSDALLDPVLLLEAVRDSDGRAVNFVYRELNQAACEFLGLPREELLGRGVLEDSDGVGGASLFADCVRCLDTGEPVVLDNLAHRNEMLGESRHYDLRVTRATPNSISVIWRDATERFVMAQHLAEARERQELSDARYRRLVDNSAIGMGLITPEGRFQVVNQAMCDFFGYDLDTLRTKTWQQLTAQEYLDGDQENINQILAGNIESYRTDKQYIHADGRPIWGDLSLSCVRTPSGHVENFVVQIIDVTAEVAANRELAARDEQNRLLGERVQAQTDRLAAELRSAAMYVASILPEDLEGRVQVSASYLPSQELAGDIFDYRWLDDDHLIVYLIDVSGHGIGPALLSVSVHNMLRSGSLGPSTLLEPGKVLTELNRSFQMENHDHRYLTMWFGVYQASSRTFRYASAGAPPGLAVAPAAPDTTIELSTGGQPLGMFDDVTYTSGTYTVPHGCHILIYSDGAYEDARVDGRQMSMGDFKRLFTRHPESPSELVASLRNLTPAGMFDDDCSLLLLKFD